MDRLKDKVAVVTGSTSGIGVGIARLYAQEGAKVVICGRREEKGQAVVDEIRKEGERPLITLWILLPLIVLKSFFLTQQKSTERLIFL